MKTTNLPGLAFLFAVISVLCVNTVSAQQVSDPTCAYCGHRIHSAYDHATNCRYYPQGGNNNSGGSVGNKISPQQKILLSIFSKALTNKVNNNTSNTNSNKPTEQEIARVKQLEEQRKKKLAALISKQKHYNDSIAQAKHDQMMAYYKPMDGSGELKFKSLDDESWKPSVHFNCKITAFKGKVIVFKTTGESIELSDNKSVDLAPGDWIATGKDSRIKMHYAFENGGEDMTLLPNSAINIITDENGTHIPELVKGDMYVVNKRGERQYYQEGGGLIDQAAFEANKLKAKIENRIISKMNVRTPSGALAIRGTEFKVSVDDFENTEVNVKSGVVDLTGNLLNGTITLTAGTKGIVKATGEIIGPLEMDEKQFVEMDGNW